MKFDETALEEALDDLRDVKKDLEKARNLQAKTEKTLQEVDDNLKILKERVKNA
jgi:hypothetical protein